MRVLIILFALLSFSSCKKERVTTFEDVRPFIENEYLNIYKGLEGAAWYVSHECRVSLYGILDLTEVENIELCDLSFESEYRTVVFVNVPLNTTYSVYYALMRVKQEIAEIQMMRIISRGRL